jgi:hypothetical protein
VPETTFTTWFFAASGSMKVGKKIKNPFLTKPTRALQQQQCTTKCFAMKESATMCFFSSLGFAIESATK